MSNKIDCEVVQDLLPLYHDDVVSDKTREIVKEHLDNCSECRNEFYLMCKTLPIENEEVSTAQKFINSMKSKRNKGIIIKVLLVLVVFSVWFFSHPLTANQALKDCLLPDWEVIDSFKVDNNEVFFLKNYTHVTTAVVKKTGLFYNLDPSNSHNVIGRNKDFRGTWSTCYFYEDSKIVTSIAIVWEDIEQVAYSGEFLKEKEYDEYSIFYGYSYDNKGSFTAYDKDFKEIDFRK